VSAVALCDELTASLPDCGGEAILHGDYRLENVLVRRDRVVAVLDWELSTVGDPLTDLGLLVSHRNRHAGDIPNPATALGVPSAKEMVARFAEGSGRDVSRIRWYESLPFLTLAVIAADVHRRTGAANYAQLAVSAAQQGHEALEKD
jgi:aminoglycoside phosphotransferase (APT) family kinase protein